MLFVLSSIWISGVVLDFPVANMQNNLVWQIDKNEIHEGGIAIILVPSASRRGHQLTLAIGKRKPVELDKLGRVERSHGQTMILLSHDLMGAIVDGDGHGTSQKVTIPPYFAVPGVVELTIYIDGKPVETKSIHVVAADEEAEKAIELLFPTVDREAPRQERERDSLWSRLVLNSSFGSSPPITPEQIQQLRDELPIIMKHPDWAEIAEMLVGRLEARLHSRELIVREEGHPATIKKTIGELPPWPEIVTRCLEAKPRSPFAQAIQRNIRSTVNDIRILDAQRHGQDVISIIKSSASHD